MRREKKIEKMDFYYWSVPPPFFLFDYKKSDVRVIILYIFKRKINGSQFFLSTQKMY